MIALHQKTVQVEAALYLHFPYCISRCTYCDFNAHVAPETTGESRAYIVALLRDIDALEGEYRLRSVFLGGGTPSLNSADWLVEVLDRCRRVFEIPPEAEITIEANPGTVDEAGLAKLRAGGVNRISFGVQSFDADILRVLNRVHTPREAALAAAAARTAGFDNLSLDLIYGLPGQNLAGWEETLTRALELEPEHLSIYQLVVEPGTHLERQVDRGEVELPVEDETLAMDRRTVELLPRAGFRRYEISNWSQPGRECLHNQIYWRDEPYLGLGCGAVSYIGGWRFRRIRHPVPYARALAEGRSPLVEAERLGSERALKDGLMLALRTRDGLDLDRVARRYQADPRHLQEFLESLPDGWVHPINGRASLTGEGLDFWNEIYLRLMDTALTVHPPAPGSTPS
ncbi:MAG: radical SAM family heme chaperone HemW [Armatimonadetes bacterium]|nr:radical SAM family heme chaperone HemW [Armatimonadota bacterium]